MGDLLDQLQATPVGLTSAEATRRLRRYGPNSLVRETRFAGLIGFLRFLADPLLIVLLVASAITLGLGDPVGGLIIISMVLFRDTAFGEIAQRLVMRPPETELGRGIRQFGLMITRVIMVLVLFVLLVNIIFERPLLESSLFSVALAVGMTPEMMPMIITVTLAQGARRMARKKVLVKQLAAIEDFGERGDPLQRQDGHPDRRRDRARTARRRPRHG